MEPFIKALGVVTRVMQEAAATHPDEDRSGSVTDGGLPRAGDSQRCNAVSLIHRCWRSTPLTD